VTRSDDDGAALASTARKPARRCSPARAGALDRSDVVAVAGIVLAGVVAPALLALATHSLGIPRDDDWAFRRVLFGFTRTGRYSLVGWGSMTLVGQVLWATPFVLAFGAQPWVPSLATQVLAAGGLASCYLVARYLLSRPRAVACTLLVVSLPGFALSTSSFMTDVPAMSTEMVCLLLGALALRSTGRAQLAWLGASMAAGVLSFSIREFSLAAPLAVLVTLAWCDRRLIRPCAIAGALATAACLAVYLWSASLPGAQPKALVLPGVLALETLGGAYFTLSFMVLPVLPWAVARWELWRRPVAFVAAGALLAAGAVLVHSHHPVFIGNYLDEQGAGGERVLEGTRPELFPPVLWEAFRALALSAGAVLAAVLAGATSAATARTGLIARRGVIARNGRAPTPIGLQPPEPGLEACRSGGHSTVAQRRLVLAFTWVSVALLAGYALVAKAAFWDRYLWPVAFGVAVLALTSPSELGPAPQAKPPVGSTGQAVGVAAGFGIGTLLALVAVAISLNSDAYDAARWSAGKDLVAAGYPAEDVDAGFDWVGAHEAVSAHPGRAVAGTPTYETWYDKMFPGFRDCALVSSSPLPRPSLKLYKVVTYNELALAGTEHLFLYEVTGLPPRHC